MKINIRYQSIIEYYDIKLSRDATEWIDTWLRKTDLVSSYENPDYIEIMDITEFEKEVKHANPPDDIKREVEAFFDTCRAAYRRLGTIFIDFWP